MKFKLSVRFELMPFAHGHTRSPPQKKNALADLIASNKPRYWLVVSSNKNSETHTFSKAGGAIFAIIFFPY